MGPKRLSAALTEESPDGVDLILNWRSVAITARLTHRHGERTTPCPPMRPNQNTEVNAEGAETQRTAEKHIKQIDFEKLALSFSQSQ